MQRGQRQRCAERAMKPGAEQADEADESGGRSEKQSSENQDKAQAEQRLATPALAKRVDLSVRARNRITMSGTAAAVGGVCMGRDRAMAIGWVVFTGMAVTLAAQDAKPAAKAIALQQSAPGYQELLSGAPTSAGMKSGLVVLAPGKSVGEHSTGDHEEMVVVLEGKGEMVLADGRKLPIGPNSSAYSPPGTEHDVINTGSGVLRYIYVVSPGWAQTKTKKQGGDMQRVTGIGGVFFKAKDPKGQYAWYEKHLGIKPEADGSGAMFHWRDAAQPEETGVTIWSIFPENTKYFGPGQQALMMNYRVDNLDALLAALREEGVTIDPKVENAPYGKFAWIIDPEGNRIELWEPPKENP